MTDNQGTVRDVVQLGDTTPVDHLVYSAFGQLLSQTASAAGDQPTFYYNGTYRDPQTGQNLMGLRWQDPVDGDWDSEDPISFAGGQTNLSEYCGNNPVNFIDPSGLHDKGPMGTSTLGWFTMPGGNAYYGRSYSSGYFLLPPQDNLSPGMAGLWYFWNNPGNTPGSKLVIPWSQLPPALGGTGAHGGAQLPARQAPAKIPDRVVFRLMARRATPAATRRLTKDTIQLGLKVPSRQRRTCRRCPRYQPCPLHRRSRRSKRTRSREPAGTARQQPRRPTLNWRTRLPGIGRALRRSSPHFMEDFCRGRRFRIRCRGHSFHRLRGTTHPSSSNSNSTSQHTTCHAEKCG